MRDGPQIRHGEDRFIRSLRESLLLAERRILKLLGQERQEGIAASVITGERKPSPPRHSTVR
ncbi:MAG: hypothetical protein FD149_255 [Rhodospirillaceae bacterium]|nr:MAG: hypothetical protein FD149_255 [Rhodospirillaceae bacterium]